MGPTWDMEKGTHVLYGHPRLPGTAPQAPSGSQNQGSSGSERTFKVIWFKCLAKTRIPPSGTYSLLKPIEFNASRSSQSRRVPQESSHLIPSLSRWRHFPNQRNSLFRGHPASPATRRHLFTIPLHVPLSGHISVPRMSHAISCLHVVHSIPLSGYALCTTYITCTRKHTYPSRLNKAHSAL